MEMFNNRRPSPKKAKLRAGTALRLAMDYRLLTAPMVSTKSSITQLARVA